VIADPGPVLSAFGWGPDPAPLNIVLPEGRLGAPHGVPGRPFFIILAGDSERHRRRRRDSPSRDDVLIRALGRYGVVTGRTDCGARRFRLGRHCARVGPTTPKLIGLRWLWSMTEARRARLIRGRPRSAVPARADSLALDPTDERTRPINGRAPATWTVRPHIPCRTPIASPVGCPGSSGFGENNRSSPEVNPRDAPGRIMVW
jgi:hypothetical protein